MILKPRNKPGFWTKFSNYLWPSMGWGRFLTYVRKRIIRLSDSPHNIALGIGFGLACSFNPFVGTHIVQAAFLAWIFGANIPASALGTLLGNPSTFPFLWWSALVTGEALLKAFGLDMPLEVTRSMDFEGLLAAARDNPEQILLPWSIGAYVVGTATLPLTYGLIYPLIRGAKAARFKMIEARKKYLAKKKQKKEERQRIL